MAYGLFSKGGLWRVHQLKADGSRGAFVAAHDEKPKADAHVEALNSGKTEAMTSGTKRG